MIGIAVFVLVKGGIVLDIFLLLLASIAAFEWHNMTKKSKSPYAWKTSGVFYIALPFLSVFYLLDFPGVVPIVIVWVCLTDIGAYAFGRIIGGTKLAPKISPKKTWAGLFGGMFMAGISPLVALYIAYNLNPTFMEGTSNFEITTTLSIIAVAVAVISQAGDLFESWVKRRFGVKDSGRIIPGHGGVLDRIDGYMFVMPIMAVYVMLGQVWGQ